MGQCYTVYLKMKLKDADEFVRLSRKYATDNNWSEDYMRKMSGVDGIIKQMISTGDLTVQCEDGWPVFRSDFDASYSWEDVMYEWFDAVAPALEDWSELEVYPDAGGWRCVVHDGKIDRTYDEGDEDEDDPSIDCCDFCWADLALADDNPKSCKMCANGNEKTGKCSLT